MYNCKVNFDQIDNFRPKRFHKIDSWSKQKMIRIRDLPVAT
jgi:hypothetical protein